MKILFNIKGGNKTKLPNDIEWKEFKLNEIFGIKNAKNINSTKLIYSNDKNSIPHISRQIENNAIKGYVLNYPTEKLNVGRCLCIDMFLNTTWQEKDFLAVDHILVARNENLNQNNALFCKTIIEKFKYKFSYSNIFCEERSNLIISLPSKNNEPDWKYMDKFIEERKKAMKIDFTHPPKILNKIKLIIQKIKNFERIELEKRDWREFVIEDIFDVKSTKTRELTKYYEGNIPFVSGISSNNGIEKTVSTDEKLENGNCITVSSLNCSAFYQAEDFIGRGHGVVQRLYNKNLNKNIALFICPIIKRLGKKYGYNNQCFLSTLKKEKIFLPSKNNEPDWEFMNKFIENTKKTMRIDSPPPPQ